MGRAVKDAREMKQFYRNKTVLQKARFTPAKRGCGNKLCLHCCACPSARACVRAPQCPHATRSPPARTRAHAAHPHARTSRAARQNGTKHHRLLPPTRALTHHNARPPPPPRARHAPSHTLPPRALKPPCLRHPRAHTEKLWLSSASRYVHLHACERVRAYVRAPQCSASRRCLHTAMLC